MAEVLSPQQPGPSYDASSKRKRGDSRSPSPPPASRRRSRSPADRISIRVPSEVVDRGPARRRERELQNELRKAEAELAALDDGALTKTVESADALRLAEMKKMALTRAGGAYIPPHKMRAMMDAMEKEGVLDEKGQEYQRLRWDALRKSLNGLVNKVNVTNIRYVVNELFAENLRRGRGLFCRSIMRAQASSLPFTPVFAALVAVVNSQMPSLGELLCHRLVLQFRRAFKRNDKVTCIATTTFIAQLANQRVIHEILVLEMLFLLLERPTDDSVEIAVGLTREVGLLLAETGTMNESIYSTYRDILHRSDIDKRVQYMIETLFQTRRENFKDHPLIPEGLDLLPEEDAITHRISLDDTDIKAEEGLNVFKYDPNFEETEEQWKQESKAILGSSDEEGSEGEDEAEPEQDEDAEGALPTQPGTGTVEIYDQTGTDVVNFRRRVYLTLMSALDFEEAVHKLLKGQVPPGFEPELCNMVVECCSQERTFKKFYPLIAERLCKLSIGWSNCYDTSFRTYYDTIHRYDTNKLRNIAHLFGHLIANDAIPWTVFEIVHMNEDETTSSSRIFIKIVVQEMVEHLGLPELKRRFAEPTLQRYFDHMFPTDNPKNTRFAINFWTAIKMGLLTEAMREHLKNAPQLMMQQRQAIKAAESSDSDSSSTVSSSSDSDSDSEDDRYRRRSPPPKRRSPSPARRRRSPSDTPPRRSARRDDSPPPRRRDDSGDRRRDDRRDDSRDRRSPPRRRYDSPPRQNGNGYRRDDYDRRDDRRRDDRRDRR